MDLPSGGRAAGLSFEATGATVGVLGDTAEGEVQARLGHKRGLAGKGQATGLPHPGREGRGAASMVRGVFQNILKDNAQRGLGGHKI